MMEFTYSRTALMMCGVILMAGFAAPFMNLFDDGCGRDVTSLAEKDAGLLDAFWSSDVDELTLNGDAMLPSAGYSLRVEGNVLTITSPDGSEHTAAVKHDCGSITLSYGQILKITKNG